MFDFLKRTNEHPDPVTGHTQKQIILAHLKSGKTLTQLEATHKYGITALSQRVGDLRRKGHNIKTLWGESGNKRWAIYKLEDEP